MNYGLFVCIFIIGFFILLFSGVYFLVSSRCESRWSESGFNSKYGFLSQCQIEISPGKYIPEDRYREIE